jgi:hypothetical protein
VPSGCCTLVVDCTGCTPEGHTGRPDSKDGRSMRVGLNTPGRVRKLIRPDSVGLDLGCGAHGL